jgi:HEAT repeat protein
MEDYTDLVKALKAYDWSESGAPLLTVDGEIRKIVNRPEKLTKLEDALLEVLGSEASLGAKRGVCKSLSLIATERSVPALAAMLTADATSDMARYVLERAPSGAADSALREALAKARGHSRVGIVNSIGNRRDARSVGTLSALLDDPDEEVAKASAWALGRIGGHEAVLALATRRSGRRSRVGAEIFDAYLVCARRLASQGNKAQARGMYREMMQDGVPAPVRKAAERGERELG